MRSEDRGNKYPNRGVTNQRTFLSVERNRGEHLTEGDGMLEVHFLYVMDRWKSRSSISMKDSQPFVPEYATCAGTSHASVHH
jgi:hypothetical protein